MEDIPSPITKLVSINEFHAKTGPMETKFLDTLAQHLLTNHNIYVYHRAAICAYDFVQSIEDQATNKLPSQIVVNLEKINLEILS